MPPRRERGTSLEVRVSLKPGVADAEGEAVKKALELLSIRGLGDVTVSKVYRLTFPRASAERAARQAELAVQRLLANPVIHAVSVTRGPPPGRHV